MFRRGHFPSGGITRFLILCASVFLVLIFLFNSNKFMATSKPPEDSQLSGRLKDLLGERAAANRKVLAEHGLALPAAWHPYQRILVISAGQSGSTFTGELLSQIPGAVYNYEPFIYADFHKETWDHEKLENKHVSVLSEVLQCNYGPLMQKYQGLRKLQLWLLRRNAAYVWCREVEEKNYCENKENLAQVCQHFPIQVTKMGRMPLRYVVPLLERTELNLHVILLTRDPRGTVASRRQKRWCQSECADPQFLCNLLEDNYKTALRMAQEFPGRITVIRYEDIATEPETRPSWLLTRLGAANAIYRRLYQSNTDPE